MEASYQQGHPGNKLAEKICYFWYSKDTTKEQVAELKAVMQNAPQASEASAEMLTREEQAGEAAQTITNIRSVRRNLCRCLLRVEVDGWRKVCGRSRGYAVFLNAAPARFRLRRGGERQQQPRRRRR